MQKWYDIAEIHRDKEMRDSLTSFRARKANELARYARSLEFHNGAHGRPRRITLLTEEGVRRLYRDGDMPKQLVPFPVPIRLTDRAREHIIEGNLYSTHGLEMPPRTVTREVFIDFIQRTKGAEHLYEPDFLPL